MKQSSGLESLIEALKASGVNMGEGSPFGGSETGSQSSGAGCAGTSSGAARGSSNGGSGSSRGSRGFGGFGGNASEVQSSLAERMGSWGKRTIIIAIIVLVLILAGCYWWFHPPINIHSIDCWLFGSLFVLLPLFLVFWVKSGSYKNGTKKAGPNPSKAKTFKYLSFIPVAVLVLGVLGGILSLSIIPGNAEKYYNVLQVDALDFAEDIPEVDYSNIPIIDAETAVRLGNKEMGSIPEYVSQFEVSDSYSQINYQNAPVRVSPLGYADLFKWFINRTDGIPAYVLVDMTTQEAQVVRLGDSPIHYSESEPLVRNIDRHVQLSYPFYMFDEKSFEIDEDGHPWWICPVQTRTIGLFGGTTISRVVLCDATTGECQDLALDEVPEWVDRVFPADLLVTQYNWHGLYVNGWLNSLLGQQDVVQTTPGTDGMSGYNYIAKDDDVWVYTGVTSVTSDSSIVGFVLMNQRTQESHFYSVSGATEDSAMSSAEGQVQNLRYTATFPLLINVADQPTYFMALKDGEGLVKKFAMVNIQSYQNVAVGDTVKECQNNYIALLSESGVVEGDEIDALSGRGTIERMTQVVVDGDSHFYVQLEGDDALYDFALPGLTGIVTYLEGDPITFTYLEGEDLNAVQTIE